MTIGHRATLLSQMQILVPVAAECPAGVQASFSVQVSQQNALGPNTQGSGFGPVFTCTGARQSFFVSVTAFSGAWTPGSAFASARLFTNLAQQAEDSRVITIS